MDSVKVKPCPFCGCKKIQVKKISPEWADEYCEVRCLDCDVMVARHTELEAIESWNARAKVWPTISDINITDVLKQLMRESTMTREEAADKAGLSPYTVKNFLEGKNMPKFDGVCWLLGALGKHLEVVDNE